MRAIRVIVLTVGLAAFLVGPALVTASAAATPPSDVQTCPVPIIGLDPDSVTVTGPIVGTTPGVLATATVIASETTPELGAGAPRVQLSVFRTDGANALGDLLNGLLGPSTSGGAHLSGPSGGSGAATETITFTAPGNYTFAFLVFFDNGIHPCTSLLPSNHTVTISVPTPALT
jgi:hypothetical protein